MNCFHVPRGFFGYHNYCSTLATSIHVDNLDLAPALIYFRCNRSLRTSTWDMSHLHATLLWSLACRLSSYAFPITRYSIHFLCTDQSRHFLTNLTRCAGVPPTLLHLPDSHLNRSPRLPLVRLWIPVNRKSYLLHRTASTSAIGHSMTRKRRKNGNETMIQMMT